MSHAGRILIAQDDRAILCRSIEELASEQGRRTLSRLFKNYIAAVGTSPMEALYSATELKRVLDTGDLVNTAVSRVASLHAKGDQTRSKEYRDRLHGFGDQLSERLRNVDQKSLPDPEKDGFDSLWRQLVDQEPPAEQGFLARIALARVMIKTRQPWDKLKTLLDLAEGSTVPLGPIDDFLADLLADIKFIEQLPGTQRNLSNSLQYLSLIGDGEADGGKAHGDKDRAAAVSRLSRLIATGRVPGAVRSIALRIAQQLAAPIPLSKDRPSEEEGEFFTLAQRLTPTDQQMIGDGVLAEGLSRRQARLINKSGPTGLREGAERICSLLTEPGRQARFLLDLAACREAPSIYDTITKLLRNSVKSINQLDHIDRRGDGFMEKARRLTALHRQIAQSGLPELSKAELTGHLEGVLMAAFRADRPIDKLETATVTLYEFSTHAVTMCLPTHVPAGKAADLIRAEVLGRLRRPRFDEELVESVADPAARPAALRKLFGLMRDAGFV